MKDRTVLALAAMGFVAFLEAYALTLGIDGAAMAGVVAVLAGLGGYGLAKGRVRH